MSPDYALTYDDLLPPRTPSGNTSLYNRLAEEHLKRLPPEIRKQYTVDRLKGAPNPRTAMSRAYSFSRLRGFHRVGGTELVLL
jgi:hypothetical protein